MITIARQRIAAVLTASLMCAAFVAAAEPAAAGPTDIDYIKPVYQTITPGAALSLPTTVTTVAENGTSSVAAVSWSPPSADDLAAPGEVVITGTVSGASTTIPAHAYVTISDYVNLALNKPGLASSTDNATTKFGTTYSASRAFDGNRTAGEWSRWNSLPNNQTASLRVDLQSAQTIDSVRIFWEIADAASYTVEVGSASGTYTTVATVTGSDGGVDTIGFAPRSARYVRVTATSYGSPYSLYSINDMEVFNTGRSVLTQVTPELIQAKPNWANPGSSVQLIRLAGSGATTYTVDGTDPRTSATRQTYSAPIPLTAARTVIKSASSSSSSVSTNVYYLYPTVDPAAVPTVTADAHPNFVQLHDAAWNTAVPWAKKGTAQNGYVDRWHDEAFNDNFFQVDAIYVAIMNRFSNDRFPSIDTLDNSYRKQSDLPGPSLGYINREQTESNGFDFQPYNDVNSINPPLFAWAEWLYYEATGDASHFKRSINGKTVLTRLVDYYNWIKSNRRLTSGPSAGLYYNAQLATSYDNTPASGQAWIDMSAQQAASALFISRIADLTGDSAIKTAMDNDYSSLVGLINSKMWDPSRTFYFNKTAGGGFDMPLSGLGLFPLLARVPTQAQAQAILTDHLLNTAEFNTQMPLPNLAANDPNYTGTAFRGSVTFNNTYQVINGLDEYGFTRESHDFAVRTAEAMSRVLDDPHLWQLTGSTERSIWSSYSPNYPYFPSEATDANFVGWSGMGATTMMLENVLGIKPDAPSDALTWDLNLTERHGVDNLRFGNNRVSLRAAARASSESPATLTVTSDSPLRVNVSNGGQVTTFSVAAGTSTFTAAGPGAGNYEAEAQAASATAGSVASQDMRSFNGQWGSHAQVIWGATATGQALSIPFNVSANRTGNFSVGLTRAPDFGRVQLAIDGVNVGGVQDLYGGTVGRFVANLGTQTLNAGSHVLTVTAVGKNASSTNFYAGIDNFLFR